MKRFWDKVVKTDTCWVWTASVNGKGYGSFGYGGRVQLAHRVSWQMHCGPIPPGLCVCHACDNPSCVRPDHLFLGTIKDNNRDRDRKGRGRLLRGNVKTVPKEWHSVARALRAEGLTYKAIAGEMPVRIGATAVENWLSCR
jgi:hypothetical protein